MKSLMIPKEVANVIQKLQQAGFEAYAVGGCVRDLLRGETPQDWDVTTSAKPEEIQGLFPESFYENKFFTVTVKTGSDDPALKEIEVTTYRAEGRYTDKRHPDEVKPAKTLEEDLSRRDFTINAIALSSDTNIRMHANDTNCELIDPFGGQKDLEQKIIRAVGNPEERFQEDALRMMRAVRFAGRFGFSIEEKTREAIQKNAGLLQMIAKERIRDEFVKIIEDRNASSTLELMHDIGLLKYALPELEEGIGMDQRGPHKYDVWEHNLRALDYAASQNFSTRVRIAALLHDVGKARTRVRRADIWTFYGHDLVGAKMAYEVLMRLRFSEKESEVIANLVRWHLFNYKLPTDEQYKKDLLLMGENPNQKDIEDSDADVQETTDSAIRRLIRNVGAEYIHDLVRVRMCDRIATGVPKAVPYRLRHFQFRVEKVLREGEATNVRMLAVNGADLMERLTIPPGPRVGHILNTLLEEALDAPEKNTREYLLKRMEELHTMSDEELAQLRAQAQEKVQLLEEERVGEIKKKYYVK